MTKSKITQNFPQWNVISCNSSWNRRDLTIIQHQSEKDHLSAAIWKVSIWVPIVWEFPRVCGVLFLFRSKIVRWYTSLSYTSQIRTNWDRSWRWSAQSTNSSVHVPIINAWIVRLPKNRAFTCNGHYESLERGSTSKWLLRVWSHDGGSVWKLLQERQTRSNDLRKSLRRSSWRLKRPIASLMLHSCKFVPIWSFGWRTTHQNKEEVS